LDIGNLAKTGSSPTRRGEGVLVPVVLLVQVVASPELASVLEQALALV